MQSDPLIQAADDLQSYNRYSYCMNGVLNCTDPSGYSWLSKTWKKVWNSSVGRAVIAVGITVVTAGWGSDLAVTLLSQTTTAATVGYSAAAINTVAAVGGGIAAGFSTGLVMSGGDPNAALSGAAKGGLTAGVFSGIGETFAAGSAGSYTAHAVAGCVSSVINDGKCGSGALSQTFSKIATVEYGAGYFQSAVVGGTTSAIGGGKFANGAITGAFGYLFNNCVSNPAACDFDRQLREAWNQSVEAMGNALAKVYDVWSSASMVILGGLPAVEGLAANAIAYNGITGAGPLGTVVAGTFRSGTYTELTTSEVTTLYRVWGGKAGELGPYWTRTAPNGPVQSVLDSALNPAWGNSATNVTRIQVPAGVRIYEGFAAPQGGLVGGGSQVVIPRVNPSWIVR